ncbi:MAG: PfkB family carbohydrate kinase [Opitutales bacterium]|jgi:sugar/nucleoside kinase (ribokinase family)
MSSPRRIRVKGREADPVLVVGSVAYDSIVTPHESGERILGGSASYACLAASYFAPPRIVGVVGHDFAAKDRKKLERRGVDLTGLHTDTSGRTFFWRGRYHENYNRRDTEDLQLNVFEHFSPRLPEAHLDSPYVLLGNIRPDLQLNVLDQLKGPKFVLADTIDVWIETQREKLAEVMRRADLLVINDTESAKLTGEANVIRAGKILREHGCRSVIIKKGEHGAVLFHQEGLFALPAYPVTELRDPTGAGDSFAGAMLGHLASVGRHDFAALKQGMLYGTAVASLTVEAFSTDRLAAAGCAEIRARRKALLSMMKA